MITRNRVRALGCAAAAAMCATVVAATPASAAVPSCGAADLSAKVTDSVAGMSQPTVLITVTNISGVTCKLNGYPAITGAWSKKGQASIAVSNGPVQGTLDKGPRLIRLAPGGNSWFALGTATAYDPPVVNLTRIAIATNSSTPIAASIKLMVEQPATAPKGKRIPVVVTAFARGIGKY